MNSSEDSRYNESEPPAVRILPPDGHHEMRQHSPQDDPSRRWLPVGLGVAAATLGLLLVVTLPDGDAGTPTTSTAPAPLLSEFEATAVDLTTTPEPTLVDAWKQVDIPEPATTVMYDLTSSQGMLFAAGAQGREPQVWVSFNGLSWRPVAVLETPPDNDVFALGEVLEWQGGTIGVGMAGEHTGIWFAAEPDTWEYLGTIDGFPEFQFPSVAAGPEVLALVPSDTGFQGWISSDLTEWTALGELSGLQDLLLSSLSYHQGSYYALGSVGGDGDDRRAAIYRSGDGLNWTEAHAPDGGPISIQAGEVQRMVATDGGYVAIGNATDGNDPIPLIWRSVDGESWWPQLIHEAFAPHSAQLALASIDLGTPNRATLEVDGTEHVVVEDSVLDTDAGVVLVTGVTDTQLKVDIDGTPYLLNVGSAGTIRRVPVLHDIAAQEERLIIAGGYLSTTTLVTLSAEPRSQTAVAWTSVDAGTSWERSMVSGDDSTARRVGLIGNNIAVVGASNDSAEAWHAYWNTDAAEAAAIERTRQFIDAVNSGDAAAVAQFIPNDAPGATTFELPSLGGVALDWWQGGTGGLNQQAMADTLAYMSALNTEVVVASCSSSVRLGNVETIRVVCDFSSTSDLMHLLGMPEGLGRFEVNYQAGKLTLLDLHLAPSRSVWQTLSDWAIDAGIDAAGSIDVDGTWEESPVFGPESAAVHLDLARRFTAALLMPGGVRVTDTPFGTMEWRWVETLPGGVPFVDTVAHTELGFIAVGWDTAGSVGLWQSTDGLEWSPLPTPNATSIWNPVPFRGGVIAPAQHELAVLALFDGSTWSEVPIPHAEDNQQSVYVVPNGDEALIVTSRWTRDDTPPTFELWKLSANDTMSPVLDPWTDESPWPIGFAPLGDGYIVATTADPPSSEVTFHYTDDGASWTRLADTTSIPDAAHLWHLAKHGERLLLFGQLDETRCTNNGRGQDCDEVSGFWTSVDGRNWEPAGTGPEGPIGSFTVGSGPLGLIAVGQLPFDADLPQPIYLSTDGTDWVRAPGFSLYEPETSWSWGNIPAVSDDTIIVPRVSFYEGSPTSGLQSEHHWLIIGRLLDD